MIKGMDKAKRRLALMEKNAPRVIAKAMTDAVIMVEDQAVLNVTGGNPLHVGIGRLRSSVGHKVRQKGKVTEGTVGTNVFYGKVHETGEPRFIYPKRGKYLKFRAGRRGKGPWVSVKRVRVKRRPWLGKAATQKRPQVRKRFKHITKDLLKTARA